MEAHAMITSGQEFEELVYKSLTNVMEKSTTHHVDSYNPKIKLSL